MNKNDEYRVRVIVDEKSPYKLPRKQTIKMKFLVEFEMELDEFHFESKWDVKPIELVKDFDEQIPENELPILLSLYPILNRDFKEKAAFFEKHLPNHLKKVFENLLKQFEAKKKYQPAFDYYEGCQNFLRSIRKAIKQIQSEGKKLNCANVARIIYDRSSNPPQQLKRDFETYSIDYDKFKCLLKMQ